MVKCKVKRSSSGRLKIKDLRIRFENPMYGDSSQQFCRFSPISRKKFVEGTQYLAPGDSMDIVEWFAVKKEAIVRLSALLKCQRIVIIPIGNPIWYTSAVSTPLSPATDRSKKEANPKPEQISVPCLEEVKIEGISSCWRDVEQEAKDAQIAFDAPCQDSQHPAEEGLPK